MADEYIKKKDIEQKVTAITGEWKDGPEFWIPIEAVLGNIDLLPAEDVAPVRHGRWEYLYGLNYKCSECDAWFSGVGKEVLFCIWRNSSATFVRSDYGFSAD